MPTFLCTACGTSYPEASGPPERCPICADERQSVPAEGQRWTIPEALAIGHADAWRRPEPDLFEIPTQPAFGIGQRAFLVRMPDGNVLWDCVALCDAATLALVEALGGIAISRPHDYTTMQNWAAALDAPVHLHARDRAWVMRSDHRPVFWEEDRRTRPRRHGAAPGGGGGRADGRRHPPGRGGPEDGLVPVELPQLAAALGK